MSSRPGRERMRARCSVDISGRVVAVSLAGAGSPECVDGTIVQAIGDEVDLVVGERMAFDNSMILNVVHKAGNAAAHDIPALSGEVARVFGLPGCDCCILVEAVVVIPELDDAKVPVHAKHSMENKADRHLVGQVVRICSA